METLDHHLETCQARACLILALRCTRFGATVHHMGTEKKDPYTLAVAAQLRAEIAAAGLTVVATSQAAGVPRGTLVRYLDGTREIPISAMYKISTVVQVPVPVIVERADARYLARRESRTKLIVITDEDLAADAEEPEEQAAATASARGMDGGA